MPDYEPLFMWKFNLKQLMIAITLCAIALRVVVAELPPDLQAIALCVPLFYAGAAISIGGTALVATSSLVLQGLGEFFTGTGVVVIVITAIAGATMAVLKVMILAWQIFF